MRQCKRRRPARGRLHAGVLNLNCLARVAGRYWGYYIRHVISNHRQIPNIACCLLHCMMRCVLHDACCMMHFCMMHCICISRGIISRFELHFVIIILSTLYTLVGRNQPKTGDRCAIVRRRGEGLGNSRTPPTFMRVDYGSGRLVTWRQRKHCAAFSAPAAGAPPSTSSTTIPWHNAAGIRRLSS